MTHERELFNACNGLLGLLQIIASRSDVPSDIAAMINPREGATLNHRIVAAREAIANAANSNADYETTLTRVREAMEF